MRKTMNNFFYKTGKTQNNEKPKVYLRQPTFQINNIPKKTAFLDLWHYGYRDIQYQICVWKFKIVEAERACKNRLWETETNVETVQGLKPTSKTLDCKKTGTL